MGLLSDDLRTIRYMQKEEEERRKKAIWNGTYREETSYRSEPKRESPKELSSFSFWNFIWGKPAKLAYTPPPAEARPAASVPSTVPESKRTARTRVTGTGVHPVSRTAREEKPEMKVSQEGPHEISAISPEVINALAARANQLHQLHDAIHEHQLLQSSLLAHAADLQKKAEIQYISNLHPVRFYYADLQKHLLCCFVSAQAILSNNVKMEGGWLSQLSEIIQAASNVVSLPGIGIVTGILSTALENLDKHQIKDFLKKILDLLVTNRHAEHLVETLSLQLVRARIHAGQQGLLTSEQAEEDSQKLLKAIQSFHVAIDTLPAAQEEALLTHCRTALLGRTYCIEPLDIPDTSTQLTPPLSISAAAMSLVVTPSSVTPDSAQTSLERRIQELEQKLEQSEQERMDQEQKLRSLDQKIEVLLQKAIPSEAPRRAGGGLIQEQMLPASQNTQRTDFLERKLHECFEMSSHNAVEIAMLNERMTSTDGRVSIVESSLAKQGNQLQTANRYEYEKVVIEQLKQAVDEAISHYHTMPATDTWMGFAHRGRTSLQVIEKLQRCFNTSTTLEAVLDDLVNIFSPLQIQTSFRDQSLGTHLLNACKEIDRVNRLMQNCPQPRAVSVNSRVTASAPQTPGMRRGEFEQLIQVLPQLKDINHCSSHKPQTQMFVP